MLDQPWVPINSRHTFLLQKELDGELESLIIKFVGWSNLHLRHTDCPKDRYDLDGELPCFFSLP